MPKVTDEYRSAKRDEIARAAMRCLQRQGVAHTTMSDIIRESGASAGSIYSHFEGKADIARYLTEQIVGEKLISLSRTAAQSGPISPSQTLEIILSGMTEAGMPMSVVVQLWAESTVVPELGEIVHSTILRLRAGVAEAILPWARSAATSEESAVELAERQGAVMVSLAQAYILSRALSGSDASPRAFLDGIATFAGAGAGAGAGDASAVGR